MTDIHGVGHTLLHNVTELPADPQIGLVVLLVPMILLAIHMLNKSKEEDDEEEE